MPKFIRRKGGGDLQENQYYNAKKWVGDLGVSQQGENYQCTYYAWQRSQEIAEERTTYITRLGEKRELCKLPMFNRSGFGNAKDWYRDAIWPKTTLADEARLGDVVVYGADWGGGYGHVRIIEQIFDDYFICSGGNEDNKGGCRFDIKISKQDGTERGLIGYIHNPFITSEEKHDEKVDEAIEQIKKELEMLKSDIAKKDKQLEKDKDKFDRMRGILDE